MERISHISYHKYIAFILTSILLLLLVHLVIIWEKSELPYVEIVIYKTDEFGSNSFEESDDYDLSDFRIVNQSKAWFFNNGTRYPEPAVINGTENNGAKLLPFEQPKNDRILNQLMFIPPDYDTIRQLKKLKTILIANGIPKWWDIKGDDAIFSDCPVCTCRVTENIDESSTADLVFFHEHYVPLLRKRSPEQVYALYHLESPPHTNIVIHPDAINWTITYRYDSTITTSYGKWVYYDPRTRQMDQNINYAANKTKKVAWFVSNCWAKNNRLAYARELQKHIQVDIYGACGDMVCPPESGKCEELLDTDYKFYLSFENSNCKNYLTEKLFNGLRHNVIPIVMGAPVEDYEKYAPMRSFIHVDDFESPKHLAEYLHVLDQNDNLYNSYFKWRGTGEFISENMWCRICALLHDEQTMSIPRWYSDINEWWNENGICTQNSWRSV